MQSEGTLSPAEFPTLSRLNSTPHYNLVPPAHTLGDVYIWLEYTGAQRYSFMKTVCALEKCEKGLLHRDFTLHPFSNLSIIWAPDLNAFVEKAHGKISL